MIGSPSGPWLAEALALATALAAAFLIGIERGWSLRREPSGQRVAGVRTFTLLGLVGGIGGLCAARGLPAVGAILTLAGATLLVVAYSGELRERGDATSAVAALGTLAIGFIAGTGSMGLALAAAAIVVLTLALRNELHGLVARLSEGDIKALARFAVIALALFPFLPDRDLGPYAAWNPSKLWWVVVIVTGFSFLAYIANRLFGATRGTLMTALIGGAYSSTAVTQSLAQRLGSPQRGGAESAGIALASAVMYLRVVILVAVLAGRLLLPFVLVIGPALITAWLAALLLYRRTSAGGGPVAPGNPIALLPALSFLAFIAAAAVAARWAEGQFGQAGIAVLLFVMGVMDVDSSIVTAGGLPAQAIAPALAATAIGGTIVANMAVKIGVTLVYARGAGRAAALALGASTLVLTGTVVARWLVL